MQFKYSYECSCQSSKKDILTYDYDHNQFKDSFLYRQCKSCETLSLVNGPHPLEVSQVYPPEYGAYKKENFGFIGTKARNLAAYVKRFRLNKFVQSDSILLEVGCGANPLITGFNLNPSNIYLVDHKISNPDLFKYNAFEIDGLHFIEETQKKFDIIVFNQFIEHIPDPLRFLKACVKCLNVNGLIYFETPDFDGYEAKWFLNNGTWGGLHAPRHLIIFNRNGIEKIAKKAGALSLLKTGVLLNPFLWNQTLRAILIKKGISYNIIKSVKLSNPFLLGFYLLLDFFFINLGRKDTGNRFFLYKKNNEAF